VILDSVIMKESADAVNEKKNKNKKRTVVAKNAE
jgi:hypothetical protein